MRGRRWILDALLAAGAIVFAYWGAVITWGVVSVGQMLFEDGTGGLGAVSAGFTESIVLAILGSVIANRLLSGVATRSGGAMRRLHRAHSLTWLATIGYLAVAIVFAALSTVPGRLFVAMVCLAGSLLALQFWLLSLLLAAFIRRRAMPEMA